MLLFLLERGKRCALCGLEMLWLSFCGLNWCEVGLPLVKGCVWRFFCYYFFWLEVVSKDH